MDEWEIAYANKEYGEAIDNPIPKDLTKVPKCSSVTVKNLQTGEEQTFSTYVAAERYFGLSAKCLSAKASKKPDMFVYKEQYRVTKHYN